MRSAGLRGISRAKAPRTTIPGRGPDDRPDLVERDFTATAPNQLWVGEITYCRTFAAFIIEVLNLAGTDLVRNEVESDAGIANVIVGRGPTGENYCKAREVAARFPVTRGYSTSGDDGTLAYSRISGVAALALVLLRLGCPAPTTAW